MTCNTSIIIKGTRPKTIAVTLAFCLHLLERDFRHAYSAVGNWVCANRQNDFADDKTQTAKTLAPEEALEKALCFGWIDGLIKRVDEAQHIKYLIHTTSYN